MGDDIPIFVLNSDVICEYPLKELLEFHNAHDGEATIVATKVDEPSKYGVIVHDRDVLNPSVIDLIEMRPTSIEHETFPILVEEKKLYSFDLQGYWMDVGQPKDYLTGMCLYL